MSNPIYGRLTSKSRPVEIEPHRGGNGCFVRLPDGSSLALTYGSMLAFAEALDVLIDAQTADDDEDLREVE